MLKNKDFSALLCGRKNLVLDFVEVGGIEPPSPGVQCTRLQV